MSHQNISLQQLYLCHILILRDRGFGKILTYNLLSSNKKTQFSFPAGEAWLRLALLRAQPTRLLSADCSQALTARFQSCLIAKPKPLYIKVIHIIKKNREPLLLFHSMVHLRTDLPTGLPNICVPLVLLCFAVRWSLLPFRTTIIRQTAVWAWATQSQLVKTQSFLFWSRPN